MRLVVLILGTIAGELQAYSRWGRFPSSHGQSGYQAAAHEPVRTAYQPVKTAYSRYRSTEEFAILRMDNWQMRFVRGTVVEIIFFGFFKANFGGGVADPEICF